MAYQFENVKLDKGMYSEAGTSFTKVLEKCDPSEQYKGTPLEHLDAFQRQLKRFDIKVKGPDSDVVSKFFATWRELTTILVVDDVIPAIRQSLQARFRRTKNTQQVRSAIRSQVILELEHKKGAEIITDYGEVEVGSLEEDPSVCLVTFGFQVAHGLNQIWLSAQITV